MSLPERLTPVMAAMSALSTLACCLPIGLAATVGAAGVVAALSRYRGWLMGLSAALLTIGVVQVVRARRSCRRGSQASLAVLIISAGVVVTVFLFPQAIAGLLADWLP
jgi:hypothetical protein